MKTLGYIRYPFRSSSSIARPSNSADSAFRVFSISTGLACLPGRSVIGFSPFRIFFCNAFGHPPGGWPRLPFIMSMTESGNDTSRSGSSTSARVRPWLTIISAMSPTTLDEGVTLTMSPNIRFTSA